MSARRLNQVSGDLDEDASVAWFKARFAARAPAPAHQASTATQLPISGQSSSARSTAPSAPFAPAPRSMLDTESHHSSPANPQIHQPNNHQSNTTHMSSDNSLPVTPLRHSDWQQAQMTPHSHQTAASMSPGPKTPSSEYRGRNLEDLRSEFKAASNFPPVAHSSMSGDIVIQAIAAAFTPKARTFSSQSDLEFYPESPFQRNSQKMPSNNLSSISRDRAGLSYDGLRGSMKTSAYDDWSRRESLTSKREALERRIAENKAKYQTGDHGSRQQSTDWTHSSSAAEFTAPITRDEATQDIHDRSRAIAQAQATSGFEPGFIDSAYNNFSHQELTRSRQEALDQRIKDNKAKHETIINGHHPNIAASNALGSTAGSSTYVTNKEQVTKPQLPIPASSNVSHSDQAGTRNIDRGGSVPNDGMEHEREAVKRALGQTMVGKSLNPKSTTSPSKGSSSTTSDIQRISNKFRALASGVPEGATSRPAGVPSQNTLIDLSTPPKPTPVKPAASTSVEDSVTKPQMHGGLADDPNAFFGAAKDAMAAFKAKQSGPKKPIAYPDQEEVTFFTAYSAPEPRDGPPAGTRRVVLSGLPSNFSKRNVADLVHGGALDSIVYTPGNSTAAVTFCQPDDAKRYYDATPNGIQLPDGQAVFVDLDKQVIPQMGYLKLAIERQFTRVVRIVGVDRKVTPDDLKEIGKRTSGNVEHVNLSVLDSGARRVEFRMCSIGDALALAQSFRRDPDWEHCNITYGPDPCAVATGPRFSS